MSSQIYSQPASTSTGADVRTNVIYAIDRLKEKSPVPVPAAELISYVLPAHKRDNAQDIRLFRVFLGSNEKVTFDPKADTYSFRPLHNIFTADDLLHFLQTQDTALGISVRELKDGWGDVETTIDALEKEHKLLVTRNKKDNHPRMVWADDPTLIARVDGEYKELWDTIPVPEKHDDVIKELVKEGYKPAGTVSAPKAARKIEKQKKKTRRGIKITNTHMGDIFRDYSGQRPVAKK